MSDGVRRFEDLIAWRKARGVVAEVYRVTAAGAFSKDWGLRDQIRRAAVSVMSNIAEGFERGTSPEFHQFLTIAKSSCGEVRSQLYVAMDAGYIDDPAFQSLLSQCEEVSRILSGLRGSIALRTKVESGKRKVKSDDGNGKPRSVPALSCIASFLSCFPLSTFHFALILALSTFLFPLSTGPAWGAGPNTWDTLAAAPATVAYGGALVYPGSGDTIYAFRGGGINNFWGYNTKTNAWTTLTAPPAAAYNGAALVYPGSGDTIYGFPGNNTTNFWGYNTKTNAWTTLTATPAAVYNGGALVYPGSGDTIYAFRGNTFTDFWGYNTKTNAWTTLAVAPAAVYNGGALVYPGSGDTIYAFRGNLSTTFWGYNTKTNAWTTLMGAPDTVNTGAALVYPGSGDTIYAFRGDVFTDFWGYNTKTNAWTTLTAAPATVQAGGALVYPGSGDTIYAFRGSASTNFWGYTVPFYAGPTWYVNDASTAGDSFTTAVGDTTGDGSSARPFLTITKALTKAKAGDTIYIDAGLYTETVVINVDSVALIGVDSGATVIDPPGDSYVVGLYGIYADTQVGLTIKNLGVTGAYTGIYFYDVDGSTIENDSASSNGNFGIDLEGNSDTNTIKNNTASSNAGSGIHLFVNSNNNTVSNNTASSNSFDGISLDVSNNNTVSNNTVSSNAAEGINLIASSNNTVSNNTASSNADGIVMQSGSNNTVSNNTASSNTFSGILLFSSSDSNLFRSNAILSNVQTGLKISGSNTNEVHQNEIRGSDTGVQILGTSSGNTLSKNNISGNTSLNVQNAAGLAQTVTRNWFGSADSVTIAAKVSDTVSAWQPWRLGQVDTAAGADTTAPKAPDTVAVIGSPSDTSVILEWTAVTTLEEVNGGAVGLSGYRVYRSKTKDSSSWEKVGQTGSTQIRFQDTTAQIGVVYYYRVTAFDAATFENESFFSDSQPSDSAVLNGSVNIYVNDTSTTGDSYTTAAGSDVTGHGTKSDPFRTIMTAMKWATAGDTIYVDAGLYTETVVINADNIALIGKDSAATIIDPPGANSTVGLYGIYADTQVGLTIKNIGVTGAYDGIHFYNVDNSRIEGDSASSCGNYGIYLRVNSDTNTVTSNTTNSNSQYGIYLYASSNNNTVTSNTANSNVYGIYLDSSSNNNTMTNNTANSNTYGISLLSSSNNTVTSNTTSSNARGIYLSSSSNNTVTSNTASSNTNYGIFLGSSSNNTVTSNTASSSTAWDGILLASSSDSNTVTSNTVSLNSRRGISLSASSNNTVIQNEVRNNGEYQVYIETTSSSDTVQKNNIKTSGTNPDSGVYNGSTTATNKFTLTRNWWNSTDTARIKKMIYQASSGDSVIWQPFRLGQVDTTAGADTTAPKAPDTVAVIGAPSDTSIILEWSAVSALEESNGGAVGLSGYRVYRSSTPDTSSWTRIQQLASSITRFQDTDVTLGSPYYYRVTAFDAATFENESFFSDSQPSDSAQAQSRVNWYVNDTSTAGDSFTSLAGSDVTGNGTANKPLATITKAMSLATPGDTVWVDAGTYTETVVINTDNIALIGKDSAATIIDPPGINTTSGLYGIFADSRVGLTIKNLAVTGAFDGIRFDNVDSSTVSGDSVSDNGSYGIHLRTGSDFNTISGNAANANTSNGIFVDGSSNNTISNNAAGANTSNGIYLFAGASSNTVSNNTANSNSSNGILLNSVSNNTVTTNTANSNSLYGIQLNTASSNKVTTNTATSNNTAGIYLTGSTSNDVSRNVVTLTTSYGLYVDAASNNNMLRGNVLNSNTGAGVLFVNSDTNALMENDISANDTGVWFSGTAVNNLVTKNNITANDVNNVRNQAATTQTLTRNWWGTTDETLIAAKFNDAINTHHPYRLGAVDTTAGGDTTAPAAPSTFSVAFDAPIGGPITISWVNPTTNEETNGGTFQLQSVVLYRLVNTVDTTHWANPANEIAQVYGDTQFIDTNVVAGSTYYYRLTAIDSATPFENESYFNDTNFYTVPSYNGPNWYVNDAYTAADSYTYAGGSDTLSGHGSATNPYRSLAKVMQKVKAGDTIWLDAGTYGGDTWEMISATETAAVNLDTDNLALIGVDSNATVIDPPGANTPKLYGIYADTQTGFTIKNLAVTGAYDGIHFENVDSSVIENISADSNGIAGIYLRSNSDNNTVQNNTASSNTGSGISLNSSSNNTVANNTFSSNSEYGIFLSSSSNNTLSNNTANLSLFAGISLFQNSNTNLVRHNAVLSNVQAGLEIDGANTNEIHQNDIRGSDTGVHIYGASSGNTLSKNNITGNAVNNLRNTTAVANTQTRNWWGTTDEALILAKYSDTFNAFSPYRLGQVDTAAGADTRAPAAPDTITADTSVAGQVKLSWINPTVDEDGSSLSGFAFVNVFRLVNRPDTTHWLAAELTSVNLTSADTTWIDTSVKKGNTYYYRLTAEDTLDVNESFFSDDTLAVKVPVFTDAGASVVFVSNAGDSQNVGSSDTAGAYPDIPSAIKDLKSANGWDTIVVYSTINTDSYFIDNGLSMVMDTGLTIISAKAYFGSDTGGGPDTYARIHQNAFATLFTGAVSARLEGLNLRGPTTSSGTTKGVEPGDSMIIRNNIFDYWPAAVSISTGKTNVRVEGNRFTKSGSVGFYPLHITGGDRHTVKNNLLIDNNGDYSIKEMGTNDLIEGNTVDSAPSGVYLSAGSARFVGNVVKNGLKVGVEIGGVIGVVAQNEITGWDTGINLGASPAGPLKQNNIRANTKNLTNASAFAATLTRNWWGTTDEDAIDQKLDDTANDFRPYRLGPVDTAAGADTVAPLRPDTVTVDTGVNGQLTLTWTNPTANEDADAGAAGFAGLNIWRLQNIVDTNNWAHPANLVKQTNAADTTWTDTAVVGDSTYYYRLTSKDAAPKINESFFSDTVFAQVAVAPNPAGLLQGLFAGALITGITPGDTILIRVTDTGANTNAGLTETVTVQLKNLVSSEQETVTLTEKDADDAVFEANFRFSGNIADNASGSGRLHIVVGDTVRATYTDPTDPADTEGVNLPTNPLLSNVVRPAPDTEVRQGDTAAIFGVSVFNDLPIDNLSPTDTIIQVQVTRLGGADTYVVTQGVKFWLDTGTLGNLNPAVDILLDSGTFSAGVVTFNNLTAPNTIFAPGDTRHYLVTLEVIDAAPVGDTLDLQISAGGVSTQQGGVIPAAAANSAGILTIKARPKVSMALAYDTIVTPASYSGATGDTIPGATMTVLIKYDNDGGDSAANFKIESHIPVNTNFDTAGIGLASPHSGAAMSDANIEYLDDSGVIIAPSPASAVKRIRWTFPGAVAPDNGDVSGVVDGALPDVDAGVVKYKVYIK